jgi:hypothetical protein
LQSDSAHEITRFVESNQPASPLEETPMSANSLVSLVTHIDGKLYRVQTMTLDNALQRVWSGWTPGQSFVTVSVSPDIFYWNML